MAAQVTFRDRFIAWWEGYDLPPARDGDGGAEEGAGEERPAEDASRDSALGRFRERFQAWWSGYDCEMHPPEDRPASPHPFPSRHCRAN